MPPISARLCREGTYLGGNASMVRAGQPEGGPPAHALIARHDVLQRHEHGVPHVKPPRDVRRGHCHCEGLPSCRFAGLEVPVLLPPAAETKAFIYAAPGGVLPSWRV